MKRFAFAFILLFLGCANGAKSAEIERGLAKEYPDDQGIEKDKDVIFACDFSRGGKDLQKGDIWQYVAPTAEVVSDKDLAFKKCAMITATRGKDEGGRFQYYRPDKGVDQCYLRFYVKFHKDAIRPHHFVGMGACAPDWKPGGRAGQRKPGDKWFCTAIEPPFPDKPLSESWCWVFYAYWHQMRSWENLDGTTKHPPEGNGTSFYGNYFMVNPDLKLMPRCAVEFTKDKWTCVEFMLKANTPGKMDGEQAYWIDGVKIGHWKPGYPMGTFLRDKFFTTGSYNKDPQPYPGLDWRTTEKLKINQVWFQWYVSGNSWKTQKTDSDKAIVYFDNIVLATRYIGPVERTD